MTDEHTPVNDASSTPVEPRHHGRRATRRRRRGARAGERGVALLMVMTSIALLYVLAQQSRDEVEIYSTAAAAARDQTAAFYQAKSMVNLGRLLLHAEPTIRRALTPILGPMLALMGRGLQVPQLPVWEQADLLLGAFRNQQGAQSFGQMVGVDVGQAKGLGGLSGALPVRIVDEDAKINVNGLDRSTVVTMRVARQLHGLIANPSLEPFFTQRDADGQFTDRVTLVDSLIDYADADQVAFSSASLLASTVSGNSGGGAEDNFYSLLHPPFLRRNAPFDSVEEIRMTRGFGDDDFWQSVVDPDPARPHRRTLTVWGQGKVNVNTANAQTILALICSSAPTITQCTDPSAASQFISGVTMIQAFTLSMGIPLFSNAQNFIDTISGRPPMGPLLAALGVQPIANVGSDLQAVVTTESKVFSIYAEAVVGLSHTRIHAVVDMRAQPAIPGTFLRGSLGRDAASNQVLTTPTGTPTTVSSHGGTIVYWRED